MSPVLPQFRWWSATKRTARVLAGTILLAAQAGSGTAAGEIPDRDRVRQSPSTLSAEVVRQIARNDCGLAAFATLARRIGVRVDLASLERNVTLPEAGASLAMMREIALRYGIELHAVRVGSGQTAAVARPWIAHMNWRGGHFVVVDEVTASGFTIGDPAVGRVFSPVTQFIRGFTGNALVLDRALRKSPDSEWRLKW